MRTSFIVFRKELKDATRDRRTLMAMVVVPLLLFPLLIGISSKFMGKAMREAQERTLQVAFIGNGNASDLRDIVEATETIQLREEFSQEEAMALVESDSLDALLVFDGSFDETVASHGAGKITYYYKRTDESRIERQRVREILGTLEERLRSDRFAALGLDPGIVETVDVTEENLASMKEQIASTVGGFLPYLFIIFCFTGSMYVAIDVAAGEKERGTLETLLTAPADRFSILLGKFGVVVVGGLLAAGMSMLGMYMGVRTSTEIPEELMSVLSTVLEPQTVALLLFMLVPLTIFFAAILVGLSLFARSYKEAQSIISPMMIAIIVPAFMGMVPGMKLTVVTALVPIMNVTVATKSVLAGRVDPLLMTEMFVSLTAIALISVFACSRLFERESTIFRGM